MRSFGILEDKFKELREKTFDRTKFAKGNQGHISDDSDRQSRFGLFRSEVKGKFINKLTWLTNILWD